MKQSVHDNINPFVGVSIDRTHELFIVWRHCFRGTLADQLFPEDSKDGSPQKRNPLSDNDFKGAFVRDIIKVIYLKVIIKNINFY